MAFMTMKKPSCIYITDPMRPHAFQSEHGSGDRSETIMQLQHSQIRHGLYHSTQGKRSCQSGLNDSSCNCHFKCRLRLRLLPVTLADDMPFWRRGPQESAIPVFMHLGFFLEWIGLWIVFGRANLVAIMVASVIMLGTVLFVLFYEEPTLRKMFGADDEEYCGNVPPVGCRGHAH
jgi:hypothetical protein